MGTAARSEPDRRIKPHSSRAAPHSKKERVEQRALHLFSERGFDDVTASEIAADVGISRRTFFRYFPGGKDKVVMALLHRQQDTLLEQMVSRPPEESAVTALRASLLAMAAGFEVDRQGVIVRAGIAEQSPRLSAHALGAQLRLQHDLTRIVAVRLGADPTRDVRPTTIVGAMLSASSTSLALWVLRDDETLSEILSACLDVLEEGLRAADAR